MARSERRNELARSRGFSSYAEERKSKSRWTKARRYGEFRRLTKGLRPSEALARSWLEAFDEPSGSKYAQLQGKFLHDLHEAYRKKWLDSFRKGIPNFNKELADIMSRPQTPFQESIALKAFARSPEENRRAGTFIDWNVYRSEYSKLHPKK